MRGFCALNKNYSSDFGKTAVNYSAFSVPLPEGLRFPIFTHERKSASFVLLGFSKTISSTQNLTVDYVFKKIKLVGTYV